jgi:hypothetical protein
MRTNLTSCFIILFIFLGGTKAHAKVMTLNEITQAAAKRNLSIKEKLIETHQSQQTIWHNRVSLLPKLDLYSIINSGGTLSGLTGVVENIAPFLIPANWFRVDEAEISLTFQQKSYQALWGNELLETRSIYLTMISDINSHKIYDNYINELSKLQVLAETRDQFSNDDFILEVLLTEKNKAAEEQLTLKDIINQQFYTLSQMTQLDPRIPFDLDLNTKIDSSWTFLDTNTLISSSQSLSPEVRSFDDLILFLGQLKKEIKFSFFGSSSLSQGVAGGVFDDLPIDGGWGFSTKTALILAKSKEELLKTQQLGTKETLKRQILRSIDQNKILTEKENNLNQRIVHIHKQWEILNDRLQFGKEVDMKDLIENREELAQTEIALINLRNIRSQLNDKAHRMLWWDVYREFPRKY